MKIGPIFSYDVKGLAGLRQIFWECNECVLGPLEILMLADEYDILFAIYSNEVLELQRSGGLGDLGNIKWSIALCLLAVFVIVYFSLWKGIKSSGKVHILFHWLTRHTLSYHIMVIHKCSLCIDGVKIFEIRRSDNYNDEHCNSVKITDV